VKNLSIGIKQSRLTAPQGRGIQFFPFENWQNEFAVSSELGLDEIEWVFEYENFENNPLFFKKGIFEVNKIIEKTGVVVRSVSFDYFIRRAFYKYDRENSNPILLENKDVFNHLFEGMSQIGSDFLVLPVLDDASIRNTYEEKLFVDFLSNIVHKAKKYNIVIGLESDYPPEKLKILLDKIANIKLTYDIGNSAGFGYDAKKEFELLGYYIKNIHVKDKPLHGHSVGLGTGNADFNTVFTEIKNIEYNDSIILETARGADMNEKQTIAEQISFVKNKISPPPRSSEHRHHARQID